MSKSVLVTGMSGLIGSAFHELKGQQYKLSALNRRDIPGVPVTQADLADFDAIRPAFNGQDAVVHLAAALYDDDGWDALLQTNVVGMRNVLEASVQAGVKRVVFTSSGATIKGWEDEEPYCSIAAGSYENVGEVPLINEEMATRPSNLYGATKVWGEAIGRHYAYTHGLEVICLRIGFANEADKPESPRQFSVWNSQRDVANAIDLAIDMPMQDPFDTFFIASDNKWGYRDISHAKEVLGFSPLDSAEDHR